MGQADLCLPHPVKDLTNVQTDLLLDLTKPALSFVSEQRFKDCLYPSDLLKSTVRVIEQFRPEIIAVLNVLLPRVTRGWARQRGEIFGFGDTSPSESTISSSTSRSSECAFSKLDAERSLKSKMGSQRDTTKGSALGCPTAGKGDR